MNTKRTLRDNIEYFATLITALLLISLSILDLIGGLDNIPRIKDKIPTITLLSVGSIGLYLALERRGKLDEIAAHIQNQEINLMQGKDAIYAKSIDILRKDTHEKLWITGFTQEDIPEGWLNAMEKLLKANPNLEIRRIIDIGTPEDLAKAEGFLKRFEKHRNMIVAAIVKMPFDGPLDYFISDESLAGIGISEIGGCWTYVVYLDYPKRFYKKSGRLVYQSTLGASEANQDS